MTLKQMPLLFTGACRECSVELAAKTVAFYDNVQKTVVCERCHGRAEADEASAHPLGAPTSLRASHAAEIFAPPVAGTAVPVAGVPAGRSETKRGRSSDAKRRGGPSVSGDHRLALGSLLEQAFSEPIVVLHARQAPGTRGVIDHIVLAPSGLWLIDASDRGKAEQRQVGTRRTPEFRLYVNGADQNERVAGFAWQVNAIRAVLDPIHLGESPIHPVVVPVADDQGRFAKPFDIDGVRVMWGKHLTEAIARSSPLDEAALRAITIQLNLKLPTKR